MDRNIIRNVLIYVARQNKGVSTNSSDNFIYNSEIVDKFPLKYLIDELDLDELDVVDFLVELEEIFDVSIFLEDFYKFKTIGDLVSKIEDAYNKERKCV